LTEDTNSNGKPKSKTFYVKVNIYLESENVGMAEDAVTDLLNREHMEHGIEDSGEGKN